MGSIVNRTRKDGTVVYSAQIVVRRKGVLHRETQTFAKRQAAATWIRRREGELADPAAMERLKSVKANDPTLGDVIDKYTAASKKEFGRSTEGTLERLKAYPIAAMPCSKIRAHHIVELAGDLGAGGGRKPQTVAGYLTTLGPIFEIARVAWKVQLDEKEYRDAMKVCWDLGLVAKADERDRRPTLDEMGALLAHFERIRQHRPKSNPMAKIIAFAIFSTRRESEICRIVRPDLDDQRGRVWVRDMKHPGDKKGNDVRCNLPPEAMAIIKTMPAREGEPRLFPYVPATISTAFGGACQLLGIEDLVFHDLRHDGISRLFEMGGTIPEVAAVSGHRSWASLRRYTHMDQTGDKYEGWAWKARLGIVRVP